MSMALAKTESNGEHAVDEFDNKSVFWDAEGANGCGVSLPIDGIEGGRVPTVPVTEVSGNAGLAGGIKQGFAKLACDAHVVGFQVHVAEGVLEYDWLEGTGIELTSRETVTYDVQLCCPRELE
jgi:hypothetical protein